MDSVEAENRLAALFDPQEIKWKPQAVTGSRALAIAYVDARTVMDRLDGVLGPSGWQDEYRIVEGGSVVCRLSCHFPDRLAVHEDVGSQSDQSDEGDRLKAAFSDALKRAAVKFGIGRYLYRMPLLWVEWDAKRKKFAQEPRLPDWAVPGGKQKGNGCANGRRHHDMTRLQVRIMEAGTRFAEKYRVDQNRLRNDLHRLFFVEGMPQLIQNWPEALFDKIVAAVKTLEAEYQTEMAVAETGARMGKAKEGK